MTNPTIELHKLKEALLAQAQGNNGWIGGTKSDLRNRLISKKKSDDRIDELVYRAEQELNVAILDIVSDSLSQVQQLALEYGIEDFAENVNIEAVNGSFEIAISGGRTDFSTQEEQMLPHLLKNGKTSKDGGVYKVIPLPKVREEKTRRLSSVDAMRARAEEIKQTKLERNRMLDAGKMTRKFEVSRPKVRMETEVTPAMGKEFRTASSTQNPATSWVKPAKNINITNELMEINSRMSAQIASVTQSIIFKYGG